MTMPPALRVADLPQNTPTQFDIVPKPSDRAALAEELGITSIKKLRFEGTIRAQGKRDWAFEAKLGATVVQPCVVTLESVTTRLDVPVSRVFVTHMAEPETADAEMPEDDTVESLGTHIDPAAIMVEALALALPIYPRKDDAAMDSSVFTEPGAAPMTDDDAKPFAGLAGLRDALKKSD